MTVLAALATAVRERLAAGSAAALPGFGTLSRRHVPARVQERPDGSRVLLPPSETVRFTQDATDPSAVAAALARTQGLDAAAAAPALRDAVDQLEAIVVATGEARLPGVGLFRRTSSAVLFAADTTLLTEINRPYAGLQPVVAAPAAPAAAPSVGDAPAETAEAELQGAEGDGPEAGPDAVERASPLTPEPPHVSVESIRHDLAATTDPFAPTDAPPEAAPPAADEPVADEPVADEPAEGVDTEPGEDAGSRTPEWEPRSESAPGHAAPSDAAPSAQHLGEEIDTGAVVAPIERIETQADDAQADETRADEPVADKPVAVPSNADAAAPADTEAVQPPRHNADRPAAPDPFDAFLDSALPIGAPGSRRQTQAAHDGPGAPAIRDCTPAKSTADGATESASELAPEPLPETTHIVGAPDDEEALPVMAPPPDLPTDDTASPAPSAGPSTADDAWTAAPDAAMPAGDLSIGEDLEADDFDDLLAEDLGAPPAATAESSLLDDIYPTDAPVGDLGAASAAATAFGLGLDDLDAAPVGTPPDRTAPPRAAPARAEPEPAAPSLATSSESAGFSTGSLLLLALSLAAIAAAATWPRFASTPATPKPTAGGGVFGDSIGDAAEAALRDRGAPTPDSVVTARRDSTVEAVPGPPPATPSGVERDAPTDDTFEPVEVTPGAARPAPSAAPERRTLGVAPPAGTAILPPRVAGLPQGQTRALASRDGLAGRGGFTWVVLSSPGRDEAQRLARRYRQSGYRAGVVATTAGGRTMYRVGVGQYGSREDARSLRTRLPPQAPDDTWLLDLSSSGLSF